MASITTFFGTQGGGGSVSGTATRVAFFGGTPGNPSTTLDDSADLEWDDTNSRLSVGDATTVASTLTVAGAGATDSTSAFEVRTDASHADLLLFRVYDNGRIDSRMLNSSEALTNNLSIGLDAGMALTTGVENTFIGTNAGKVNTSGQSNTFFGNNAGASVTTRVGHTYIGAGAGASSNSSGSNTAIGAGALSLATTGGQNIAIGLNAARLSDGPGSPGANPTNCIYIGENTISSSATANNEIVIGNGLIGKGNNTVTIGDGSILETHLNGSIYLTDGNTIYAGGGAGTKIGGPSSMIAFYDETPVVQPTTSIASAAAIHGSGQAVKDDSTFGGYTIGQIVTALQTLGLLA